MKEMRQVIRANHSDDPIGIILTMTMKRMSFILIVFAGLAIYPMGEAAKPSPVAVNKCCRNGEQLDRNGDCTVGGTDKWWPLIYQIIKEKYFEPQGEAPPFFKVREFYQPNCESPELIIDTHSMALFSDGKLFLTERNQWIDGDQFCIDKRVAIVCDPNRQNANSINEQFNRTTIRKCCPQNAIYEPNSTCAQLRDGHEILRRKFLENSTNEIEYRYGFPQCSLNNNNIAMVGKFNESQFDETTGNLTSAGGIFQSNQFCLEHFNDTGSVNVHVFTCAEYLPGSQSETKVIEILNHFYNIRID